MLEAFSSTKGSPSDFQIPICAGLAHIPVLGSRGGKFRSMPSSAGCPLPVPACLPASPPRPVHPVCLHSPCEQHPQSGSIIDPILQMRKQRQPRESWLGPYGCKVTEPLCGEKG